MSPYPNKVQEDAVKLVQSALSVAALPEIYDLASLEVAAQYLERQVSPCRSAEANTVLTAIIAIYRNTDTL